MIEGKFNVVFMGKTIPSKPLPEVKNNLSQLFKANSDQIERLFTGEEVTIKKNLDYAAAMKYQSALKQAGALVLIKKIENQEKELSSDTSTKTTPEKQQNQTSVQTVESKTASSPTNGQSNDMDWSLARAGEILPPTEKPAPIKEPDVTDLSLANSGEMLQKPKEFQPREVDTSELALDKPGLLTETKKTVEKQIDTSALTVAKAGEPIPNEPKPKAPPPPNIDHLKL